MTGEQLYMLWIENFVGDKISKKDRRWKSLSKKKRKAWEETARQLEAGHNLIIQAKTNKPIPLEV